MTVRVLLLATLFGTPGCVSSGGDEDRAPPPAEGPPVSVSGVETFVHEGEGLAAVGATGTDPCTWRTAWLEVWEARWPLPAGAHTGYLNLSREDESDARVGVCVWAPYMGYIARASSEGDFTMVVDLRGIESIAVRVEPVGNPVVAAPRVAFRLAADVAWTAVTAPEARGPAP